ncbi:hypothetical protein BUALT_BualtUnG0060300 [Buddleja alternifolia]|uniref:Disease resistance R13L4/SHOC-2-like LRR domain-containing protein n=1 Tax=Buddleja alternifolia TaxID=168488 RepID=A0AAV6W6L9_9LAMI|nr:hypothetical protein BUALT_BualtUnG0060300 [Buddleja alternifolia]
MTREYWEFVAENVNSLASSGNDEHCLKILSLSYNHLPIHLKSCFLSMGVFPEDFKVRVSRLIRKDGEAMCFICCERVTQGRIVVPEVIMGSPATSLASPLVCDACNIMYPQLNRLRLVRVMDTVYDESSQEFLQPTKLWYLSFTWIRLESLSPSITLLWNLQTLIMKIPYEYSMVLPSEIWEMPQLRHIIIHHQAFLPDPIIEKTYFPILENLQTLSTIVNFRCTKDVLEKIPNMKKLGICYYNDYKGKVDWSYYSLLNLANLHKLESLTFVCRKFALENIAFP